jgi:syntaxin 1B/2/3
MQKAVKSARAARRKRWICFVVILIILIAIAIGLAVRSWLSFSDAAN